MRCSPALPLVVNFPPSTLPKSLTDSVRCRRHRHHKRGAHHSRGSLEGLNQVVRLWLHYCDFCSCVVLLQHVIFLGVACSISDNHHLLRHQRYSSRFFFIIYGVEESISLRSHSYWIFERHWLVTWVFRKMFDDHRRKTWWMTCNCVASPIRLLVIELWLNSDCLQCYFAPLLSGYCV